MSRCLRVHQTGVKRKAGEAACGKSHPPAPKYTIKKQVHYVGKRLRRTARAGQLRQLEGTAPSFTSLVPSVKKRSSSNPQGSAFGFLKTSVFDRNQKIKKQKGVPIAVKAPPPTPFEMIK